MFKSYRSRGDLKILHSFGFCFRGTVKLKIQYNENRNIMSFFWGEGGVDQILHSQNPFNTSVDNCQKHSHTWVENTKNVLYL